MKDGDGIRIEQSCDVSRVRNTVHDASPLQQFEIA